jgi:hypothetical protein
MRPREILPDLVGDHLALGLAERGVGAGQRRVARALQQRGDVRQRLFFVAEAALQDVGIALVLRVVRELAFQARDARGADRILGRVWNFLPVATWFCVFASLTWFSRMPLMLTRCMPAVEMRMAYLRTALMSSSNIWPEIAMICAAAA